jgi:hypothetical protein
LDRNGFKVLPIWLNVRLAAPAALCKGVIPGLRGCATGGVIRCSSSARSSGGVRNGSSGGRCSTIGRDETEGYERNEGVGAVGATHSVDSAGSTVIVGAISPLCGDSPIELPLGLVAPVNTAASAVFCRLRKFVTDSDEPRGSGVLGRDGDGFITRNCRGPIDSR